jgi:hypothetical protein
LCQDGVTPKEDAFMADDTLDWVIIREFDRDIGAIGFLGDKAAVVAAFHDDRDANRDGRVSLGERIVFAISPIGMKNQALVNVAMQARLDLRVIERDGSFHAEAMQMFMNFASNAVADGIYAAYFARGVRTASGAVATRMASGAIKQFVIRKGFEKAVKAAYDKAIKQDVAF